jgi:fatty acid desaturase
MLPEAWRYEHNVLHHYHTNEVADPDLVEQNLAPLHARASRWRCATWPWASTR